MTLDESLAAERAASAQTLGLTPTQLHKLKIIMNRWNADREARGKPPLMASHGLTLILDATIVQIGAEGMIGT